MLDGPAFFKGLPPHHGSMECYPPDKKRPEIPGFLRVSDEVRVLLGSLDRMRTLITQGRPPPRLGNKPLRHVPRGSYGCPEVLRPARYCVNQKFPDTIPA